MLCQQLLGQKYKERCSLKNGSQESFGKLYDRQVDKLYRFVFLKIDSKESAEEITQDVFLKFWQYAQNEGNDIGNARALLYKIARNLVTDYYRSRGREAETLVLEDGAADCCKDMTGEEERLDSQYDQAKIMAEIKLLPEIYKEVLILRFIEELDIKEIAKIVEKDEGNIRVMIHRALKMLRERLGTLKN